MKLKFQNGDFEVELVKPGAVVQGPDGDLFHVVGFGERCYHPYENIFDIQIRNFIYPLLTVLSSSDLRFYG